eukprot:3546195-Rhodomonas_salina.2
MDLKLHYALSSARVPEKKKTQFIQVWWLASFAALLLDSPTFSTQRPSFLIRVISLRSRATPEQYVQLSARRQRAANLMRVQRSEERELACNHSAALRKRRSTSRRSTDAGREAGKKREPFAASWPWEEGRSQEARSGQKVLVEVASLLALFGDRNCEDCAFSAFPPDAKPRFQF